MILLGDCLERLKELEDNSVDAVITDPPYNTTQNKWDNKIDLSALWTELKRVCKKDAAIVIFGVEPFSSLVRVSNLQHFKFDWLWIKNRPDGFLNAKIQPLRKHEIVSVFSFGKCPYFPQLIPCAPTKFKATATGKKSSNHGAIRKDKPEYAVRNFTYPQNLLHYNKLTRNRVHPTQKPTDLVEYLIKSHVVPGGTILDPFAGSGSTGVAAFRLGFKFIGIEMNEEYCAIANKRIASAVQD
jgi:DNA modification methylase